MHVSEWIVTANADNAAATATRAAPPGGLSHYITSISGGFTTAQTAAKTLLLNSGAGEIGRWYIFNSTPVVFTCPVKVAPGSLVTGTLAASGTGGQVGAVTITGFTR